MPGRAGSPLWPPWPLLDPWARGLPRFPLAVPGAAPLSAQPFVELAGGGRALQIGADGVGLTLQGRTRSVTLSVGFDGSLSAELSVEARRSRQAKLSGVVRATATLGSDPALTALAELVLVAAKRRDASPARDLPALVAAALPRLRSHARGFRISTNPVVGAVLDRSASLTYLWWDELREGVWTTREELRAAAKLGFTRHGRSLRVGLRVRV